jgi:hypothetical protein
LMDVRRALLGIVEAVVGLRQALVVPNHQGRPILVVFPPSHLQGLVRLPVRGKREGFEAVGSCVSDAVFKR